MKWRVMIPRPDGGSTGGSDGSAAGSGEGADAAAKAAADKAAADTAAAAKATADKAAADKAAADAAAAKPPEKYELKLPDKAALQADAVERTATIARALGLSNAAAQQTLDFVNQEVATRVAAEVASTVAATKTAHQPGGAEWTKVVDGWKAEALADPALGKTPDERKATIDKGYSVVKKYAEANPADADAMKSFLNDSGLGNHPAAVRFFAWLGKAAAEGTFHKSGGDARERKSDTEVFYGEKKDAAA